ncbi:hypothetical protein RIR_jg31793.t1 [Rhizophagus irregularis DAOM 181602=DAOM 197198]|nr:hypothetical protein RIR_jg31793.t1 [Rhizophagus irregularis DAOM 181602=DAOM 197198]
MFRSLKWFGFWEFRIQKTVFLGDSFSFLKHEFDGSLSGGFCRFSQVLPIFWVLIFLFLYFNVSLEIKIFVFVPPFKCMGFCLWTHKNSVTYSLNFRMWILMHFDSSSTLWTWNFSGTA